MTGAAALIRTTNEFGGNVLIVDSTDDPLAGINHPAQAKQPVSTEPTEHEADE